MAELILTEAEKAAATWAELDDEALGRVVKAGMFDVKKVADDDDKLLSLAAATMLCSIAAEANADRLSVTLEGLRTKDESMGDWEVMTCRTPLRPQVTVSIRGGLVEDVQLQSLPSKTRVEVHDYSIENYEPHQLTEMPDGNQARVIVWKH